MGIHASRFINEVGDEVKPLELKVAKALIPNLEYSGDDYADDTYLKEKGELLIKDLTEHTSGNLVYTKPDKCLIRRITCSPLSSDTFGILEYESFKDHLSWEVTCLLKYVLEDSTLTNKCLRVLFQNNPSKFLLSVSAKQHNTIQCLYYWQLRHQLLAPVVEEGNMNTYVIRICITMIDKHKCRH